jgi:hypothetical protein
MTLIDAHLPVYQFRELHQLLINAAPGDLLDAVDKPGIVEDPWVQWFIRLREAPARLLSSLGYPSQLKDKPAFGLDNFTRLGRVSDREVAFGLAGRFWKFDYGLVAIADTQAFERFGAMGVPKLVLNFSAEVLDAGRTWLRTETRVFCNDRKSLALFLPYWWLIRPVSGLMRRRLLRRIATAAMHAA